MIILQIFFTYSYYFVELLINNLNELICRNIELEIIRFGKKKLI